MGLIASLPEIDKQDDAVFVMHEKSEKLIPLHKHAKGQLSYVEGGLAYITTLSKTYVVPARHYFWIPQGMMHELEVGSSGTLRSLYFYATDDHYNDFYGKFGIYPASELLIQMINYTECWDSMHVCRDDNNFEFLVALKKLLPTLNKVSLPIMLPKTNHPLMLQITKYLEENVGNRLVISEVAKRFALSERSFSRLFQSTLHISFLQYVKTLRMITAMELILKTHMPISDVAYAVGYSAVGPFSDAFYDFTLSRPSDFRKN
jgi:AraC-like DNA-binding protein